MKRFCAGLLAAAMLFTLSACGGRPGAAENPSEESAIPEDDYIHITTAEEFRAIAENLSGKYILDANIDSRDLTDGDSFRPIGSVAAPFTGELNGNGHKLSGILEYTGEDAAWGLFACNAGSIHDLKIASFQSEGLSNRYYEIVQDDWNYSTDLSGLPADQTTDYGVLCGCNSGVIENIVFDDGMIPDLNLLQNANNTIHIGLVCGVNAGTVSGVELNSVSFCFRSMDHDTAVDIGGVCGLLTASGTVEKIRLSGVTVSLDSYPDLNTAPAVNAGGVAGEIENGGTLGEITQPEGRVVVSAPYALADAAMCLGGFAGLAHGDVELTGLETHTCVSMDLREDAVGYVPSAETYACGGGLIGRAEGNVTVTDCKLQEMSVSVLTREGGRPLYSAAGGIVGWCGGDLTVSGVVLPKGTNAEIDSEGRDTWFGGLCGFCAGNSDIRDTEAHIGMSSYFYHGFTLCQSNVLGYAQGAAAFSGVKTDCGENGNQTVTGDAESVYYLAALAGCAEGPVTADGCEVDVHYNAYTGSAVLYDGSDGEGLYNTPH